LALDIAEKGKYQKAVIIMIELNTWTPQIKKILLDETAKHSG